MKPCSVPVGKLVWLRLGQLVIHPETQRRVAKSGIREIADNWRWEWFDPPKVIKVGEEYPMVNGQRRILALRMALPNYSGPIPCWLVPGSTVKDEARLFLGTNGRTRVISPADRYHVGLAAGNRTVMATDKALRRHGIIPVYGSKTGKHETQAGYAFVRACERLGLLGLHRVIRCVKACRTRPGEIDPEALRATFVAGATEYVANGGKAGKLICAGRVLARAGRSSGPSGHKRAPAIAKVLQRTWRGSR